MSLVVWVGLLGVVAGYNNGVGLKPALGWNTWCTLSDCHNGDNRYFDRCNEWEVRSIGQAMLDNGMHALGFEYVNLDDCWANPERSADGSIQPDPTRFPSGMKATAAWLHERGLKFGLYTSAGDTTCNPGGRPHSIPGSYGHYEADAKTFASWDMDYVKIDWCGGHLTNPEAQHTEFSKALNATGRPIWLELCRGYSRHPIPSYVAKVANSWRITGDHQDEWSNTKTVIEGFADPSNPGGPHNWNYGDFLMTGGPGCNFNDSSHCPRSSDDEYRTSASIWAISASPLIVSTDIRNLTSVMKQVLLNKELIEINQDYTMLPGKKIGDWHCSTPGVCHVWGRNLSDGGYAVVLVNMDKSQHSITVPFTMFGWGSTQKVEVRDVMNGKNLGSVIGNFTAKDLPSHASAFVKFTKA